MPPTVSRCFVAVSRDRVMYRFKDSCLLHRISKSGARLSGRFIGKLAYRAASSHMCRLQVSVLRCFSISRLKEWFLDKRLQITFPRSNFKVKLDFIHNNVCSISVRTSRCIFPLELRIHVVRWAVFVGGNGMLFLSLGFISLVGMLVHSLPPRCGLYFATKPTKCKLFKLLL